MTKPVSTQNRIIDQNHYDDSGNLIAQQVVEITTRCGSEGSIHRIVQQITRFKDENNEFKEFVSAEVIAVLPDVTEEEVLSLLKYLAADIKEHLSVYTEPVVDEEAPAEQNQIPVMV